MTRAKLGGFGLLAVLAACEVASQAEVRDLAPSALGGFSQSADPSLGVDPSTGDVLLSWVAETDGEWNLYFARSGDGGATFSEPVQVNAIEGAVHPHAEGAPRLVAAPGVAAVFWNNTVEAPMRVWGAQDLLVSRTTDGGLTWEPAHPVHDDTLAAIPGEHTFHGATWAGESTLVVAWLDGRERDVRHIERAVASGVPREQAKLNPDAYALESEPTDSDATIFSAVSHDLGRTWEDANRRVMGGACPCCRVQLAGTPAGDIVGVWRQHFGDNVRDPALTSLFDEGAEPIRVHADNWTFPGCPHAGPGIDVGADGAVHVVWFTGAEGRMGVHYARKAPGAPAFEPPVPIAVGAQMPVSFASVAATDDGGAVVVANLDAEGDRVMVVTGVTPAGDVTFRTEIPDSEGGTHPQVTLLDAGRALVAWTESREGVQRVRVFSASW
jgi:hypothetical protein